MRSIPQGPYLIVNADDFGYYRCVSKGILDCASDGIVTATGVFANAAHFDEHALWLRECSALDAGVHLNLTQGMPLTAGMRARLARWSGRFPGKFAMALAVGSGAVPIDEVRREWAAQIERCLAAALEVRFLNSHEHLHMLPTLLPVVRDLAAEYGIAHVRFATAEFGLPASAGSFVRGAIMKALEMLGRNRVGAPPAHFLGLEASGRLDRPRLEGCVSRLRPGQVYELMCHPGRFDAAEVGDPRIRQYHDWEGERQALSGDGARNLLAEHGVRLIGYRHVQVDGDRLVVGSEPSPVPHNA